MQTKRKLVVYWLNPPQSTQSIYPDLAWMNFSAHAQEHTWVRPIIDWERFTTLDQVVEHVVASAPDVLCVSTYVWNYQLCYAVASEVRRLLPNITIIQGGPHQGFSSTFFDQHPYVDYSCFATGHGEYFIKPFLAQLAEYGSIISPEEIPYLLSRTYSDPTTNRKYEYPDESPFEHNIEYVLECAGVATHRAVPLTVMMETTRGCPYSCTYCEWGGGTSSKVSAKSVATIKREIDLIGTLGVQSLDIIDANFGILARDIEIVEYIAEVKRATNSPRKVMLYGVAKTSVAKRERILDVLYENQLMNDYFVSFQSVSEAALQAVKRTDISIAENKALAHRMMHKYNAKARVELVMGLPGSTLDDFYAEMDLYHEFYAHGDRDGWHKARAVFTLLPDTPAAKPGYMAVNGMKAISVGVMDGEEAAGVHESGSIVSSYRGSARIVIQTSTYTIEQWKDMFLLNRIQRTIGPLLKAEVVASQFFRTFLQEMKDDAYYTRLKQHVDQVVAGDLHDVDLIDVDGLRIEDHVLRHYVLPHRERFVESLDFSLGTT